MDADCTIGKPFYARTLDKVQAKILAGDSNKDYKKILMWIEGFEFEFG